MSILDPEFTPYRHLHGAKGSLHPEAGPCFVCEGRFLVESALAAGREGKLRVLSVLATPELSESLGPNIMRDGHQKRLRASCAILRCTSLPLDSVSMISKP